MKKYIGIILGIMPLLSAAQLVMNNSFYMVMDPGTQTNPVSMVLTNPLPAAITNNGSGWIVSESEFNYVQWNIATNVGNYVVPFGYSNSAYLPLSCFISVAGTGAGVVKFSTYHCPTWNNLLYRPSDVTNLADFGRADYSLEMVDRFWEIDAAGYTTKPMVGLTFTYSRKNPSEIAGPNNINENMLIAQRFNPTLNQWDDYMTRVGTDAINGNTGTVNSGRLEPANFYRSWTLANDSGSELGVNNQQAEGGGIVIWPNPASQNLYIKFNQKTESDVVVNIVDVTGRELFTQSVHITYGMVLPIDISEMPVGIYFVRVSGTGFDFLSKFVRQ